MTTASIDTIELFFRRAPAGLRTRLEAAVGRRIMIQKCLDATGYQRGVRVIINRPNRRTLKIASQLLLANHSATLSRVDIATDFETPSEEAARVLLKLLDQHLVLKWRSPRATKERLETRGRATVYWSQGRTNRKLAVYTKKAAETIRVELRFLGSGAVRRAGLANPASLPELNPRKILERNIALVSFKDRFIQSAVRKAVSAERELHLKKCQVRRRSPSAELFIDQYRSCIHAFGCAPSTSCGGSTCKSCGQQLAQVGRKAFLLALPWKFLNASAGPRRSPVIRKHISMLLKILIEYQSTVVAS